jgi:uncharacterized OsmC-like protein
MSTRSVSAEWLGGFQVSVQAGRFEMRVDEPESSGGSDSAPQPTDYLLAAVAACFVMSLVWSARKFGVDLRSMAVNVTGTYDGPRYSDIAIDVVSDLPEERATRLIESAKRVCYVTNTLRRPPAITVRHASAAG